MKKISASTFRLACLVTALSTLASVLIASSVVPILGGTYDGTGVWMSVLCPLLISFPVSLYQFHQSEKLKIARDALNANNTELDRLHQALTMAHVALQEKSRHDAMTGALNRETFFGMLDAASKSGRKGALLLADADHFKRINDSFGHLVGDEALRSIGKAIAACLQPGDFWGRVGGEEFAIFVNRAGTGQVEETAEAIRAAVGAIRIHHQGTPVSVTLSIGGKTFGGSFDPNFIFGEADNRLYLAKRSGRNTVVLDGESAKSATAA